MVIALRKQQTSSFVSLNGDTKNCKADWCNNAAVPDESMRFVIIMHHVITNIFYIGLKNIRCIKVAREWGKGDFPFKF